MRKRSILWRIAVLLCFLFAVNRLERDRKAEGKQQLEDALRRTAVSCYASEGFYPPNVEYMVQHYGLQYDEDMYGVHYEIFASNLMPEITVLEK
jgi:hypothetical protein